VVSWGVEVNKHTNENRYKHLRGLIVPIYSVEHVILKSATSVSGARRPAGRLVATALLSAGAKVRAGGGDKGRRRLAWSRLSPRVAGVAALRDLGVFRWTIMRSLSERIPNDSSNDSSCLSLWLVTP
jgi:hypothetical protein